MATAGLPLWSTTATSNATADPAVGMAEGMAPSALNDGVRALMASVAKWRDDFYGITAGLTTGGTSTAFTVTTNSTYATAAVMSGGIFTIVMNATSGAAPTLAVDGLTARALNVSTGVAAPTGALISGTPYMVRYVHATTEFIVLNPSIGPLSSVDVIGGTSFTDLALTDTLPAYDVSATANKRILISDVLKVINLLTTDSSPDIAADYLMTYDASATAAKKILLSSVPGILPRGYIDGCILANGADTTNDITIAAGACRDSTNAVNITVAAMTTGKQLDANWAPGDAAGMRNSGAGIANTTYHIYAVAKADGTQDIYAHTSTTVATVLTALQAETGGGSYIYARLIGSIVRASTAIIQFAQVANYVRLISPTLDVNSTTLGTSKTNFTLASVPTGLQFQVIASVAVPPNGAGAIIYISNPNDTDLAPSATATPLAIGEVGGGNNGWAGQMSLFTDTSARIAARASGSNFALRIAPVGFFHPRGVNA